MALPARRLAWWYRLPLPGESVIFLQRAKSALGSRISVSKRKCGRARDHPPMTHPSAAARATVIRVSPVESDTR